MTSLNESVAALNVLCLEPMAAGDVQEVLERRAVFPDTRGLSTRLATHVRRGRAAEGPVVASKVAHGPREVKTYVLTPLGEEWLRKQLPQGWL